MGRRKFFLIGKKLKKNYLKGDYIGGKIISKMERIWTKNFEKKIILANNRDQRFL